MQHKITLEDFHFLNPQINDDCSNLHAGVAHCVAPVGDIATYSGHASSSAATRLAAVLPAGPTVFPTHTPLPLASGSDPACDYYVEPIHVPGIVDQAESYNHFPIDPSINSCGMIAATWGVHVKDLLDWNPSLNTSGPCMLDERFRYCALRNGTAVEGKLAGCCYVLVIADVPIQLRRQTCLIGVCQSKAI